MESSLSRNAARAVQKYGHVACLRAVKASDEGNGPRAIAWEGPEELRTVQQADAAINAGREIQALWVARHPAWTMRGDRDGFLTAVNGPFIVRAITPRLLSFAVRNMEDANT
jgi:hypothetical protein